jgi:hypothetical protein
MPQYRGSVRPRGVSIGARALPLAKAPRRGALRTLRCAVELADLDERSYRSSDWRVAPSPARFVIMGRWPPSHRFQRWSEVAATRSSARSSDSSSGQIEVALAPNNRYAFVSDETTGAVSVFDLARTLHGQNGWSI